MMPPDPTRQMRTIRGNPSAGALRSLLGVLLCFLAASPILAQGPPTEDDVKAAYLFNFSHFVRYPAANPAIKTFDICLLGRDSIDRVLQSVVQNENVDDRPVRMIEFDRAVDARACAIVFMGSSESGRIDKDLAALDGSNALTVSDVPHFTERGGMIQFVLRNDRVRFAVNLSSAEHARLSLSSELLKVALSVNSTPPSEAP
jgi:hypothetical protein